MSELLSEGLGLMVLGMGTVFIFLTMLVFLVGQMSRLAMWIESKLPQPPAAPAVASTQGIPPDHIAAISAAVHRYRANRH
ncbi:OadG family protein [Magnetococcus sp. PR-3]|uniref:OadG family protein n=1 Tax=Magnetococcus sp. PR-3 TaxID=3120355 RepID=UPI002FCE238B